MWPDMTKYPAQRLTAAVADALANPAKLGGTARLVNASCGLSPRDFAALVPDISVALKQLHADLPLLQDVANAMHDAHWKADNPQQQPEGQDEETQDSSHQQLNGVATIPSSSSSGSSSSNPSHRRRRGRVLSSSNSNSSRRISSSRSSSSVPFRQSQQRQQVLRRGRRVLLKDDENMDGVDADAERVSTIILTSGPRKRNRQNTTTEIPRNNDMDDVDSIIYRNPQKPQVKERTKGISNVGEKAYQHRQSGCQGAASSFAAVSVPHPRPRRKIAQQQQQTSSNSASSSSSNNSSSSNSSSSSMSRVYYMPPSTFTPAAPATMPALLVPLVFHIMLYLDSDGMIIGPWQYDQAPAFINRMVRQLNLMSKPTNIQFFVNEVRNDPTKYPNLLLPSRTLWLVMPFCDGRGCLRDHDTVSSLVYDWPRSINIFVTSDLSQNVFGYAHLPMSDTNPESGHVFISWDSVTPGSGYNSDVFYNYGALILLHEIFHHLGLHHAFGSSQSLTCDDDDYVIDTPVSFGPVYSSSVYSMAARYCLEVFWMKYGGDWDRVYDALSTRLGIPETDMNAWADSCPGKPGYDELGNYMTYNTEVCFAALGHLTAGQAQRAHYFTAEINPIMYAWGQYYAASAAPPPPLSSGLSRTAADVPDICKVTSNNCPCKKTWRMRNMQYSYCSRIETTSNVNQLWCEVEDCDSCISEGPFVNCFMPCSVEATATICRSPRAPLWPMMPPPPPPSPPSPRRQSHPLAPPPPPPMDVPDACKVASNGCACRSTWYWGNRKWPYASFCSNPDGSSILWCQVTPTCPTYSIRPYEPCGSELTASYCRSRPIYISTSLHRPQEPDISPMLPSQPPPPAPEPPMNFEYSSHDAAAPPFGMITTAKVVPPAYGATAPVGIEPPVDVADAVSPSSNGMPPSSAVHTPLLQFKVLWSLDGAPSDADLDILVSWTFGGDIFELTYGTEITRGGRYGGDNWGMNPIPNFETVIWDDASDVAPDPAEYYICVLCFFDSCGPTYNITLDITAGPGRSGYTLLDEGSSNVISAGSLTSTTWRLWDTSHYAWEGNVGVSGCDTSSPGFLSSFMYPK
ncbi:hypothetical protein Vafri_5563 [Volvox africanus]|nr:hypothetical protein Vafri_5563 [Volvox africanus]